MHLKNLRVIAVLATCVALGTEARAQQGPAHDAARRGKELEIFPLSKVRPGQTGYGLTTLKGTKPERFSFEVVDVNKNFLPKMDIILIRSDDPKMQLTGFWQGMSGSPLFIEGKLACAFSYGFRFNKSAIGGCTPLEYMRKEGFKNTRRGALETTRRFPPMPAHAARRAPAATLVVPRQVASPAEWRRATGDGTIQSALKQSWILRAPLPKRTLLAGSGRDRGNGLVPSAVPLAMSGFSAPAFAAAKKLLADFPLEPMRAGGTGDSTRGPTEFSLGSPIGVQLARGDLAATATGTVSFVQGSRVLAFGHPMFQVGEIYAPVSAAEVHTVIPSSLNSFILSSPLRELGVLVQDRQSTIAADTNLQTRMIPVDVLIRSGSGRKRERGEFHVEVINNRFFTAQFAGISAMSAISRYLPDRDHATALVDCTVYLRGKEPLHFVDFLYSPDGAGQVIGGSRGLRVLVPLLMNPFAPVEIDRIDLKVDISYSTNFGQITSLRLPTAELPPGRRAYVDVEMTTYDGSNVVERVPFDVPAALEGSIVRLLVTAGDAAPVDAAPPKSLEDLLAAFRQLPPGNVFAVVIYAAEGGVAIDGTLVRDLPASALDKLRPSSATPHAILHRIVSRSLYPSRRVINGAAHLLVKIGDK